MKRRYEKDMIKGVFPTDQGLDLYNRILMEQFGEYEEEIRRERVQQDRMFKRSFSIAKGRTSTIQIKEGYSLETRTDVVGGEEYFLYNESEIVLVTTDINDIINLLPLL